MKRLICIKFSFSLQVANLEKVVETQEAKFTDLIAVLKNKLDREIELRCELQAEIQKLERCVTRV